MVPRVDRWIGALLALALGFGICQGAAAQQKPSIAILPTQHYSADAPSAERISQAFAEQFQAQGYQVIPEERVRQVAESMGYSLTQHHSDAQAAAIGRRLEARLVAYPRLLGVGYPATDRATTEELPFSAVLHLRVIHVQTQRPIYFRQIAREFPARAVQGESAVLPTPVAMAAVGEVTRLYFERIAGSREEIGRPGRTR